MKKVERWKMEMPREEEMLAKDKYTVFDRKVKRYRKGIHSTSFPGSGFQAELCRTGEGVRRRGNGLSLTLYRGTQVDESEPEAQPAGFLGKAVLLNLGLQRCILSVRLWLAWDGLALVSCFDTRRSPSPLLCFK